MNKKAFTLIEIMIVVGILGLISSLAAVVVTGSVHKSRQKQAKAELEMIAASVLQLGWDTGRYPNKVLRTTPGSIEVWDLSKSSTGLLQQHDAYPNWNGPYIDNNLIDPWGMPYFFDPDFKINGVMYPVVGSFGPNKVGPNRYDADDIVVRLDD